LGINFQIAHSNLHVPKRQKMPNAIAGGGLDSIASQLIVDFAFGFEHFQDFITDF